jgi:hypothetical protein
MGVRRAGQAEVKIRMGWLDRLKARDLIPAYKAFCDEIHRKVSIASSCWEWVVHP